MSVNSFATGGLTAVMPWLQKLSTTQPKPLTTKRYHWNLEKRQTLDMTQEDGRADVDLLSHSYLSQMLCYQL